VLKSTGRAINKAVSVAEICKRRVQGLHQVRPRCFIYMLHLHGPCSFTYCVYQITEISSIECEPLEEGLDRCSPVC
jgi:hypothetical protein